VTWSVNIGSTLAENLESGKEWIGVAVTLLFCIRQVLYSNLSQDIDYPKFYHGFSHLLEENAGIIPV
jgi:hypothetical protein